MPETSISSSVDVMPWGISSLGCGDLTLPEICSLAGRFDIKALELRAMADRLDLPAYLGETYPDAQSVRKVLQAGGQHIVSLDSSFKLIGSGAEDREALLAFVPWAEALNVPYIRVFGGGSMEAPLTEEDLRESVGQFEWWGAERAAHDWSVELILETHDGFSSSDRCLELQSRLGEKLAITWDTHHTWKLGGEDPRQSWARMGHLVRHVHIKDSVAIPSARHPYSYVLPGHGEFPGVETLQVLADGGYKGVVCLEWERKWHPYLPPLEEALAALTTAEWRS